MLGEGTVTELEGVKGVRREEERAMGRVGQVPGISQEEVATPSILGEL